MRTKVRKRAEERENQNSGGFKYNLPDKTEFYSPKRGTRYLDILPYKVTVGNHPEVDKGELWYQRTILVHYDIGPEEISILCPKTVKKPCPVCEHATQMRKNPDADDEAIKALRPKERELYNVIDHDSDNDAPQLWDLSYHNFGKKLEEEIREGDEDWAGFAELDGGYTLKVRFQEKSFGGNKFLEASRIDFVERDKDYDVSMLDEVIDLDKILNIMDYGSLEKLFLGLEDGKVEDEEDEDNEVETDNEDEKKKTRSHKKQTEKKREKKEKEKEKCPYGYESGFNTDGEEDCNNCDIWGECDDEKDRLETLKEE